MTERIREIAGPNDLRALHRQNPARYPFLLQSTTRGGDLGRYDILFAFPGESLVSGDKDFLDALDACWTAERLEQQPGDVPFRGGWFLYLGYELAAEIEPGLDLEPDPLLPRAFAVRCPAALVFDHVTGDCTLVRETPDSAGTDTVRADIASLQRREERPTRIIDSVTEEAPERFQNAVVQAKELIAAGDIYQANLSRQWQASLDATLESSDIYEALCEANPGPFAGIVRWQDTDIISSSPERLLRIRDGIMSTRPIAGTRPRSDDEHTDNSLSAELFAHPKERAEHVMLIDLERNDLGRVCEAGSVEVDEMMVLESYAHVHHIVSNVRGRQRSGVTPGRRLPPCFRAAPLRAARKCDAWRLSRPSNRDRAARIRALSVT